jgi:hypothetical protein
MTSTLYAAFHDAAEAERAAGALLDHGLHASDISLLANEEHGSSVRTVASEPSPPPMDVADDEAHARQQVEQNEVTGTSYGHAIVNEMGRPLTQPDTWSAPGSNMAYGAEMAGGIESTDAATHYPRGDEAFETDDGAPVYSTSAEAEHIRQEQVSAPVIDEPTYAEDRPGMAASHGITTTTSADAGAGAVKGAAVGLGVGVAAALAAVFLPGIGLVLGGGAIAAALAGAAGATGAGAIAGGAFGYLKDQGVPEEALTVYREAFDHGGAILAVNVPVEVNRADIEAVLAKYGASNIDMYGEVRTL